MSFLDKIKPLFGKKKETKEESFVSKSISAVTNTVRKSFETAGVICKTLKEHPLKTGLIVGSSVAATVPAAASDTEKAYQEFTKPVFTVEAPLKAEQIQIPGKIVTVAGNPYYVANNARSPQLESVEAGDASRQIIETEINDAPFDAFKAKSFVQYEGKTYFVKNSTKDILILKDLQAGEGAPFIKVQASDNPDVEKAQITNVAASLQKFIAKKGLNATEIAHALGLQDWQKNLIFSFEADKIYDDDTKIDANVGLYGLPDANLVQEVFKQFNEYLSQFVIGDAYMFQQKGEAESIRVIVEGVENGVLKLTRLFKGKILDFKIEPSQWEDVLELKLIADDFLTSDSEAVQGFEDQPEAINQDLPTGEEQADTRTQVVTEETTQEMKIKPILVIDENIYQQNRTEDSEQLQIKAEEIIKPIPEQVNNRDNKNNPEPPKTGGGNVEQIDNPEQSLQQMMKELYSELIGPQEEKTTYSSTNIEKRIGSFLKIRPNLRTMLAHAYFPSIDHTETITAQDESKMVRWIKILFDRSSKMVGNIKLTPVIDSKISELLGGLTAKDHLLATIVASETSASMKNIFFPCDNGRSRGIFMTMNSFLESGLKNYKRLTGNLPPVYDDLRLDELDNAYEVYQLEISRIRSSNPAVDLRNQQIEQAKMDYIKAVKKIDSPVFSNPSVIADLVLANAITSFNKINRVEKAAENTELKGVKLSREDKMVAYYYEYSFGPKKLFGKKVEGGKSKPGALIRFMAAKKANPNLSMLQWLKDRGYNEATMKTLKRKHVFFESLQKVKGEKNQEVKVNKLGEFNNFFAQNGADFETLQTILKGSQITPESAKGLLKLFMKKINANPKLSCLNILDDLIKMWEHKLELGGEHSSLVQGLKNVRAEFIKLSSIKAKDIVKTAEVQVKNEGVQIPGAISFVEVAQGLRTKFGKVMDGVVDFGNSIDPRNLQPALQTANVYA